MPGRNPRIGRWRQQVLATTPRRTRVQASIIISDQTGRTLTRASGSVQLRKLAPNGLACGPVCYFASVDITPTGTFAPYTLAPPVPSS